MTTRKVVFGRNVSITLVKADDPDYSCEWCESEGDRAVIERLEQNGGWSHVICLDASMLEDLRSALEDAVNFFENRG